MPLKIYTASRLINGLKGGELAYGDEVRGILVVVQMGWDDVTWPHGKNNKEAISLLLADLMEWKSWERR